MAYVEASTDVREDIETVYDQWTQFESFPEFMDAVERVTQIDDSHVRWVARIAGRSKEWEAEIVEQVPNTRIAWAGISGAPNGGTVTFAPLGADSTRVTLRLDYEPEDWLERAGEAMGVMQRQVRQDLDDFKSYIESRGTATGESRGRIAS